MTDRSEMMDTMGMFLDSSSVPAGAPAKRGRPRKDAPIVLDGVEVLSSEEREQHNAEVADLHANFKKMDDAAKEIVLILHSIGQRMETIQGRYFEKLKVDDFVQHLGITPQECRAAKCVYLAAKAEPAFLEQAKLDGLTSLSKIIKFFKKESEKELPAPVEFPQTPTDWDTASKLPQKGGCNLARYRIRAEPTDGRFYVYHNDDTPYPILDLSVEVPRNFQQETAFEKMRDKIQVALEEYYSIIESTEEDWT